MMHRVGHASTWPALGSLILAAVLIAGCGGDEPEEQANLYPTLPPVEVAALPTDTPSSTSTPTVAPSDGPDAVAGEADLPAGTDDVVVQLARIEPSPWEPALIAQMVPHFSLQSGGFGVFSYPVGPSDDGYYQTAMTREDAARFVEILVQDIGFFELADARQDVEPVTFETPPDGAPPRCDDGVTEAAWGVIYVQTAARDGRLVISQCELNDPDGPDETRVRDLQKTLNLIQLWKSGLFREFTDDQKLAVRQFIGWWSDIRQPYSPDSAVAYGTAARARIPDDAPRATWPLNVTLTEAFDAGYGEPPVERRYTDQDHLRLIRTARTNLGTLWGPRFWGPLWIDGEGNEAFVGIRPSVPGANRVVIDYEYELPIRGIGAGR